jgi:hypothetical protein
MVFVSKMSNQSKQKHQTNPNLKDTFQSNSSSQAPVTYNPSYSGDRDQEDHGSKPAQANSTRDPISKKSPSPKRADGVAQGVGPEFKPQKKKN